jgi:hypothetical protein
VRKLTDADYCRAAKKLNCSVASVKAVREVESRGAGFFKDGFPVILFERHKFWKNADRTKRQQWFADHAAICNPAATPRGGYGNFADQREKFNLAFSLDPDAAMMACSWGMFQELGENYDDYGFRTVGEFVDMMKSGEAGQLEIFIRSILKRGLADELRRHTLQDWHSFARNYNGPAYQKFDYHNKLNNAFIKWSKEKIDCNLFKNLTDKEIDSAVSGAIGTSGTAEQLAAETNNAANETPAPEVSQTADQITNVNTSEAAPKVEGAQSLPTTEIEKTQPTGFGKKLIAFFTAIFTGQYIVPQFVADGVNANSGSIFYFVGKFLQAAYENRYLIFAGLALWYVVKKVNNYFLTAKIADTNADPTKGNIVLVDRERQPSKWKWLLFWT